MEPDSTVANRVLAAYLLVVALLQLALYREVIARGADGWMLYNFEPRLGLYFLETLIRPGQPFPGMFSWGSALALAAMAAFLLLDVAGLRAYMIFEILLATPTVFLVRGDSGFERQSGVRVFGAGSGDAGDSVRDDERAAGRVRLAGAAALNAGARIGRPSRRRLPLTGHRTAVCTGGSAAPRWRALEAGYAGNQFSSPYSASKSWPISYLSDWMRPLM